jgi:two-component system chemotaxis response regulator CheB
VANELGEHAIGCLLTGMGADGAAGLLAIQRAGGETIAQDEATSEIYGMPREAVRLGAAARVLPLHAIAPALVAAAGPGAPELRGVRR